MSPELTVVGSFVLVRRIAAGGMGVVWEAHAKGNPRERVAVKTLLGGEDAEPRHMRKFLAEAKIGATLQHPNICRVLDLGLDGDTLYMVMELLEGVTVGELRRLQPGPLPLGLVMGIGLQALDGLSYAHDLTAPSGEKASVVHRDLKPSNLFVTRSGRVKVIDFGIAVARSLYPAVTRTDHFLGSIPYSSPEQARAEEVDGRTDLFSLALVLYEMLTGRRVFAQNTDAAVLTAILWTPIQGLESVRPDLPAGLAKAIMWALEKVREERPASAAKWAEELRRQCPAEEVWTADQVAAWVDERTAAQGGVPAETRTVGPPAPPSATVAEPGPGLRSLKKWALFSGAGLAALGVVAYASLGEEAAPEPVALVLEAPPDASVEPVPTPLSPEPNPETGPVGPPRVVSTPRPGGVQREVPRRESAPGWLTVDARPGWGKVFIDGKEFGPTPLFRVPVKPGPHEVEAVRPDGLRRSRRVRVLSGQEEKVLVNW